MLCFEKICGRRRRVLVRWALLGNLVLIDWRPLRRR
jgi:hypothetical protein